MLQLKKEVENEKIKNKNVFFFFFIFEFIRVFQRGPSWNKTGRSKNWCQGLIDLKSTNGHFKEKYAARKLSRYPIS